MSYQFNPFTGTLDIVSDYKGALAAAPSNPSNGWMYFNTGNLTLYVYYAGVWNAIGSGTPTSNHILSETGDNLSAEDGSLLVTE